MLPSEMIGNAYKQAIGQDTRKIIFNFNRDAYIDSAGIAIFIQVLAHAIKRNQRIGITGLSKHFKDIERRFIERFNRLADKSFSTVPFDEDMWNYLHTLQKEIFDLLTWRLNSQLRHAGLVPVSSIVLGSRLRGNDSYRVFSHRSNR